MLVQLAIGVAAGMALGRWVPLPSKVEVALKAFGYRMGRRVGRWLAGH